MNKNTVEKNQDAHEASHLQMTQPFLYGTDELKASDL